jgi:hypothetical protein
MTTTISHRVHAAPLAAAVAVAGVIAAAGLAGVSWHEHHAEGNPTHELVLPDYGPPLQPGGWKIHRAQQWDDERPTTYGGKVQMGQ